MTRDPYSRESEQGVLGAMLIKPELIDLLSADLRESDFHFSDNREVFRVIMSLRSENKPVDFLIVGERLGHLGTEASGLADRKSVV
mgnify:CR=1 FL=1